MRIIKQYQLAVEPKQVIKIPFNSEIIACFEGKIWAVVDTAQKEMDRVFLIFSDDKLLPLLTNATKYVGSFMHEGHPLHIFEE